MPRPDPILDYVATFDGRRFVVGDDGTAHLEGKGERSPAIRARDVALAIDGVFVGVSTVSILARVPDDQRGVGDAFWAIYQVGGGTCPVAAVTYWLEEGGGPALRRMPLMKMARALASPRGLFSLLSDDEMREVEQRLGLSF